MSVSFECRFGTLGKVDPKLVPPIPISIPDMDGDPHPLEDRFSLDSDGAIRLQPDYNSIRSFEPNLVRTDAATLHDCLPTLTENPPGAYPVPRLGIFFSNSYVNQDRVFGMMFDTGVVDPFAPDEPVSAQPRQGCALFLETIKAARQDDEKAYQGQVAFDLVHEIGHIFNLQHVSDTARLCFMNQSNVESVHPAAAYKFFDTQQLHLQECGKDPNVTPGGAPFDPTGGANNDLASQASSRPSSYLQLHISMAQLEFWPWEDTQLDIRLSSTKPVSVPDELDPGYKNFEIWIETPSGERLRYRSPHHYCVYPTKLKIAPREPFVRDIAISQQAGGYTFQTPGVHKLWIDFYPSRKTLVRSNVLSVLIKSRLQVKGKDYDKWAASRKLHHAAARLLFFKSGPVRKKNLAALLQLAKTHPREHAGASARYTLGRLYHDQASRFPRQRKNFIQQAIPFLQAAANHSRLSDHRRGKVKDLLTQIG